MIEIDARVTKDSVIVNFHDPYIDATTNGTGVLGAMTYNDSSTFVRLKRHMILAIKKLVRL